MKDWWIKDLKDLYMKETRTKTASGQAACSQTKPFKFLANLQFLEKNCSKTKPTSSFAPSAPSPTQPSEGIICKIHISAVLPPVNLFQILDIFIFEKICIQLHLIMKNIYKVVSFYN